MITKTETLRASAAQAVGTETGTTANSGEIKLQQAWHMYTFVLDVTLLATATNDTLDVYIDTSYDGGTSWVNVIHFTQVLGDAAAQKHIATIHETVNAMTDVTLDAAAGAIRSALMGDRIRYRATVVDPTGADASFTYSIIAFLGDGQH